MEKIKIEIRLSQVQTTITFDRKLRLRHSTRSRKANDEIYRINAIAIWLFLGPKNLVFTLKNIFEVFFCGFLFFYFLLKIV
jgi:hypothetical protein